YMEINREQITKCLHTVQEGKATPQDIAHLSAFVEHVLQLSDQNNSTIDTAILLPDEDLALAIAAISSELESDQVTYQITKQFQTYLQCTAVVLLRFNPHTDSVGIWQKCFSPIWNGRDHLLSGLCNLPIIQKIRKQGSMYQNRLNSPDIETDIREFLLKLGVETLLLLPLHQTFDQSDLLLCVVDRTNRTFSGNELAAVNTLLKQAEIMINKAELYENSQQRSRELEAIYQTGLSLTASLELKDVLDAILRSVLSMEEEAQNAHIFRYDGTELTYEASRWQDGRIGSPWAIPRENGLTNSVARSGKMIAVEDMSTHPLFVDRPDYWSGAILGIPLCIVNQVVGVMTVAFRTPRIFNEPGLNALRMLADQAAISIENARLHERVRQQAFTDGLTNLPNRRAFDQRIEEEIRRSKRYGRALALAMLDVNHFKRFNDSYGHLFGDQVLQITARLLRAGVRETDFVARYGGDEFVVIMPETEREEAWQVVRRMMNMVQEPRIQLPDNKGDTSITLAVGVATWHDELDTLGFIHRADSRLYRAKRRAQQGTIEREDTI
ncbi:MAG TPA: sensor domain-containing diguanylate cyclase, partial [Longilinea sp.]|nr:sensor domain-containing diguanylate cyclase [Longilinea sp.]